MKRLLTILAILAITGTGCNDEPAKNKTADTVETADNDEDIDYAARGQKIADAAKAELGTNLVAAIKEYGVPTAVTYCNTHAIPLTDSMAKEYHAYIRRVTDKPRNPDNKANDAEQDYINRARKQLAGGEQPQPEVTEIRGRMVGYYPIVTNGMCLQCHGDKDKNILPETHANIQRNYPNDKATGYGENQLRGIWVIEMDKK